MYILKPKKTSYSQYFSLFSVFLWNFLKSYIVILMTPNKISPNKMLINQLLLLF